MSLFTDIDTQIRMGNPNFGSVEVVSEYFWGDQHFTVMGGKERQKYQSMRSALAAAHVLVQKYGGAWVVYECSYCDNWHLGKNKV